MHTGCTLCSQHVAFSAYFIILHWKHIEKHAYAMVDISQAVRAEKRKLN